MNHRTNMHRQDFPSTPPLPTNAYLKCTVLSDALSSPFLTHQPMTYLEDIYLIHPIYRPPSNQPTEQLTKTSDPPSARRHRCFVPGAGGHPVCGRRRHAQQQLPNLAADCRAGKLARDMTARLLIRSQYDACRLGDEYDDMAGDVDDGVLVGMCLIIMMWCIVCWWT